MTDSGSELRAIAWSQVFPFVRLFQTVRLALDFKRLALALIALMLVYVAGTVLDGLWVGAGRGVTMTVVDDRRQSEVEAFAMLAHEDFRAWVATAVADREAVAVEVLADSARVTGSANAEPRQNADGVDVRDQVWTREYETKIAEARDRVESLHTAAIERIAANGALSEQERAAERAAVDRAADDTRALLDDSAYRYVKPRLGLDDPATRLVRAAGVDPAEAADLLAAAEAQRSYVEWKFREDRGPFRALLAYQTQCFAGAVQGAVSGRWGFSGGPNSPAPSMCGSILAFVHSVVWLVTQRPWYAIFFFAACLAIFGLFGGAICRSAAIQSARDESISMGEALSFAQEKYFAFLTAPLSLLAVFFVVALLMMLGGFVSGIPRLGELFAAIVFPLTVIGGFAMAMIFLAIVLGFHLMWPTIAVEGSDGFDAVARAGNYVGSRLWHVAFYTLTLLLYGAFAFVVVRYIAQLSLKFTNWGAGLGMNAVSNSSIDGMGKLDGIWTMPAFSELTILPEPYGPAFWGDFYAAPLVWSEWLAMVVMALWVFLVVGLVGAFVVSFFFCGSTQMYFLLRRDVDATDWEEVYYEEPGGTASFEAGAASAGGSVSETSGASAPPGGAA